MITHLFSLCGLLLCASLADADPAAELAQFSAFPKIDFDELARGKVLTARSPAMNHPRHLSVQACYLVHNAVPKTAELLQRWNGTIHPPLRVYLHGVISAKPSPDDFAKLEAAPASFINATQQRKAGEFQLSTEEAEQFGGGTASAAWGRMLARRATAFVEGGLARLPAYAGNETVRASEESARLLDAQPKIRGQFSALAATALGSGGSPAQLYWNMFDADGAPHITLGAFYERRSAGQALDLRYYGSGGFLVHLTFYQFWPLEVGGAPATLVWRGDLISSASIAPLRGIERSAAGGAMMRQLERTANFFQKDAAAEQ